MCLRCSNYVCRIKYPILINSIFEKFPFFKILDIIEIIYAFLCLEKNAQMPHKYLKENKNIIISNPSLLIIYEELGDIINKYMKIVYGSETISLTDNIF